VHVAGFCCDLVVLIARHWEITDTLDKSRICDLQKYCAGLLYDPQSYQDGTKPRVRL